MRQAAAAHGGVSNPQVYQNSGVQASHQMLLMQQPQNYGGQHLGQSLSSHPSQSQLNQSHLVNTSGIQLHGASVAKKPQFYPGNTAFPSSSSNYIIGGAPPTQDMRQLLGVSACQSQHSPSQFFKSQAAQLTGNSMFKLSKDQHQGISVNVSKVVGKTQFKNPAKNQVSIQSQQNQFKPPQSSMLMHNKDTPQVSHVSRITKKSQKVNKDHRSSGNGGVNKQYDLTVRVIEANLFVSKTRIFQMNVHIKVKMDGHPEQKTSTQSGQNPKWDETFTFRNIKRKSQVEFQVFHKALFSQEELIGNTIFIFDDMRTYNIKKVIVLLDKSQEVGSLHLNLSMKSRLGKAEVAPVKLENNQNEDDIDDEVEHSIDFRDHEISRQIVTKGGGRSKGAQNHHTANAFFESANPQVFLSMAPPQQRSGSMNEQGTLQQYMAANNYQQRQQTESSIIHHYTNQSNQSFEEEYPNNNIVVGPSNDFNGYPHDSELEQEQMIGGAHTHFFDNTRGLARDKGIYYYKQESKQQMGERGTDQKNVASKNAGKIQQITGGQSRNQAVAQSRSHVMNQHNYHHDKLEQQQQQQVIPQQLFVPGSQKQSQEQQKYQMLYMEASGKGKRRRASSDDEASAVIDDEDDENQMAVPQETDEGLDDGELTTPIMGETLEDDLGQSNIIVGKDLNKRMTQQYTNLQHSGQQQRLYSSASNRQIQQPRLQQQLVYDPQTQQTYPVLIYPTPQGPVLAQQYPLAAQPQYLVIQQSSQTDPLRQPHQVIGHHNPYQAWHAQTFDLRRRSSLNLLDNQGSLPFQDEDDQTINPLQTDPNTYLIQQHQSPLTIVTPTNTNNYSMQDALEQLRNELREENDRLRSQEARLKRHFEKYQSDTQKLANDKAEVKKQREVNKEEAYRIIQQREEVEYQKKRMEIAYVNLKKDKQGVVDQVKDLQQIAVKIKSALKEASGLKQNNLRNIDDLQNQLSQINMLLQHLLTAAQNDLNHHSATSSVGTYSNQGGLPTNSAHFGYMFSGGSSSHHHNGNHQLHLQEISPLVGIQNSRKTANHHSQQSPPKVITDIINTDEDEIILQQANEIQVAESSSALMDEYEGVATIEKLASKVGDPKRLVNIHQREMHYPLGRVGAALLQTNSEHHELSTIMEREQLTTSHRRSSQDEQAITVVRQSGHQSFFPPVGTHQSQNHMGGMSSDLINPDEEHNSNLFITNQPIVKRQHPLTATNRFQEHHTSNKKILIPTTPTTVNAQHQATNYDPMISKERQLLEMERKECEERKNQLEGLYEQLHKELEDIQILKQAYSHFNSAAQMNQSGISHLTGAQHQSIAPFMIGMPGVVGLNDSRMTPAMILQTESDANNYGKRDTADAIDSTQFQSAPATRPFASGLPLEQPPPRLQANHPQQFQNAHNEEEEESMEFTPDPDFLKKINMNMQNNDQHFNNLGQPLAMTRAAAAAGQAAPLEESKHERDDNNLYQNQFLQEDLYNVQAEGMQYQDYDQQQVNYFDGQEQLDQMAGYQELYEPPEDDNHLLLSQTDIQLMFPPSVNGQPTYLLLQGPPGQQSPSNNMLLEMQTVTNTSTQGQGDRKIEYIQDDFREEDEDADNTQDIMRQEPAGGLVNHHPSPIIQKVTQKAIHSFGQQPMTSFAAALMSMQQNQEIAQIYGSTSSSDEGNAEQAHQLQHLDFIEEGKEEISPIGVENNLQNEQYNEVDGNLYGTIKREKYPSGQYVDLQEQDASSLESQAIPLELIIKGKKEKLTDEEIQKLIDENYHQFEEGGAVSNSAGNKLDPSVIYYNGKVYDEKKRAIYGIQRSKAPF